MLKVDKLRVTFSSSGKETYAVRGVSLCLEKGEVLGIVGESGCGKSALAKALVKLHPPHATAIAGQVLYEDQDLLSLSESELRKIRGKEIAMIFQDPMTSLNPTVRIGVQITEGFLRHHPKATREQAKERALALLHLVGIPEPHRRFKAHPHTLSGGMRQRVMIALALASDPKLLIADEPTTALDVTTQAQILDLLKEIQQKTGMSILLITHNLGVVARFCDRVLVMYAGEVLERADVDTLFAHPNHPYTQRLLAAIPRLDTPRDQPLKGGEDSSSPFALLSNSGYVHHD